MLMFLFLKDFRLRQGFHSMNNYSTTDVVTLNFVTAARNGLLTTNSFQLIGVCDAD
jgi:hypothetical protein